MLMMLLQQEVFLQFTLGEMSCLQWAQVIVFFSKASKTWLVMKSEHLDKAKQLFDKSNVNIKSHGRPYLGAPLGSGDYVKEFVKEKVIMWVSELSLLSDIARDQPHASYAAFIHCFVHTFSYLCRTNSDIGSCFAPLEECISTILILALTGRPVVT